MVSEGTDGQYIASSVDDVDVLLESLISRFSALTLADTSSFPRSATTLEDLPNEILLKIFEVLNGLAAPGWSLEESRPGLSVPPCMCVSYVCRRWRSLALSVSLLWSAVIGPSRTWTEQCFSRCSEVHLVALFIDERYANPNQRSYQSGVELAMQRLHTATHLHIRLDLPDLANIEVARHGRMKADWLTHFLMHNAAPVLHSLMISVGDAMKVQSRNFNVNVPSTSFSALKSASFRSCGVLNPRRVLPECLTELDCAHTVMWQNVDDMINLLRGLPNLARLQYTIVHPQGRHLFDATPSMVHDKRSLHMRHLKTVSLHTSVTEAATILTYLALPSDAHIKIDRSHTYLLGYDVQHADADVVRGVVRPLLAALDDHRVAAREFEYNRVLISQFMWIELPKKVPILTPKVEPWMFCTLPGSDKSEVRSACALMLFSRAMSWAYSLLISDNLEYILVGGLGSEAREAARTSYTDAIELQSSGDVAAFLTLFDARDGAPNLLFPYLSHLSVGEVDLTDEDVRRLVGFLFCRPELASSSSPSSGMDFYLRSCRVPPITERRLRKLDRLGLRLRAQVFPRKPAVTKPDSNRSTEKEPKATSAPGKTDILAEDDADLASSSSACMCEECYLDRRVRRDWEELREWLGVELRKPQRLLKPGSNH
ncbi:unnamed protein product [Peniophora sp. CBMAI 1063]|nr:unnamed protein product [Peniophora sp. CBMAI 1063]